MGIFPLRKYITNVEHDRALQSHAMIRRIRHGQLTTTHNTGTWGYEMHLIRWQSEDQKNEHNTQISYVNRCYGMLWRAKEF